VAENSAGAPTQCAANIVGAVYFDTDIAEFLGCTGTSWEPLGGSKGNFLCQDGWGGGTCDMDFMPPIIMCEPGTVSIQQERNVFPHTLTSADVPRPMIHDTGPGDRGSIRVELGIFNPDIQSFDDVDPSQTMMKVSSSTPFDLVFDWDATNTESDNLLIDVDIGAVTTFEYRAYDVAKNVASCTVDVIVSDIDECADGSHSCAETALCENLANSRGDQATGSYSCICPEGTTATPDGYTECVRNGPPNECGVGIVKMCNGNFPCVDLLEAVPYHHVMSLNPDGVSTSITQSFDCNNMDTCNNQHARSTPCTCSSCDGIVGTWDCPGFYSGKIVISSDYGDDFTNARSNDKVLYCAP
jgi:hypothetical protein